MYIRLLPLLPLVCGLAAAQSKEYSGPKPAKADVLFLLHASKLIETESVEAKEEKKKSETIYWVAGTSSAARTPLAEPIFLVRAEKLNPERLELYRMDVKNGRREIQFPERRGKGPKPYPLTVRKVSGNIWRVEASATLDNGQYSLTLAGSNSVFLFEVY